MKIPQSWKTNDYNMDDLSRVTLILKAQDLAMTLILSGIWVMKISQSWKLEHGSK